LICRNTDASKKILVATEILVFDVERFIGGSQSFVNGIPKDELPKAIVSALIKK